MAQENQGMMEAVKSFIPGFSHTETHKNKAEESHEEHHVVNDSYPEEGNQSTAGGILSYIPGFGGGSQTTDNTDTGGKGGVTGNDDSAPDAPRTTRSGTAYGKTGNTPSDYEGAGIDQGTGAGSGYGTSRTSQIPHSGDSDKFGASDNLGSGDTCGRTGQGYKGTGDEYTGTGTGAGGVGAYTGEGSNMAGTETINPARGGTRPQAGYKGTEEGYQGNKGGDADYSKEETGYGQKGDSDSKYGRTGTGAGYTPSTDTGSDFEFQKGKYGNTDDGNGASRYGAGHDANYGRTDDRENQMDNQGVRGGYNSNQADTDYTGEQQDGGVRGAPIEGENVKGYAVSAPVGTGDVRNPSQSGDPSGQVSGAHIQYGPSETDDRDASGRGTFGRTSGAGDSSFANVKRNIAGGTEHVMAHQSSSRIEHTSTTQL